MRPACHTVSSTSGPPRRDGDPSLHSTRYYAVAGAVGRRSFSSVERVDLWAIGHAVSKCGLPQKQQRPVEGQAVPGHTPSRALLHAR